MTDKRTQTLIRQYKVEPTDENAHLLARALCRQTNIQNETVKVIVSPGYGAGFEYNNYPHFREDPILVKCVEDKDEEKFHARMKLLYKDNNIEGDYMAYPVQFKELVVRTVTYPYHVSDYDGYECVHFGPGLVWEAPRPPSP